MEKTNIAPSDLWETTAEEAPETPVASKAKASLFSSKGANTLRRLGKAAIYLAIFLLPLFFLPWTSNILDLNKQALLLSLVFVSLICWLCSSLISNKFEINTSFFNIPVLILLAVSGLSVIFSLFRYGSFWGWPLPVSSAFLTLLGFVILYFLVASSFKKDEIIYLFLTLFISGFLASLYGIFQLFGKFILPFDFTKTSAFNTIGTANGLAVFDSLLLLLLLPLTFSVKGMFKIIFGVFIAVLLVSLLVVNFKTAWIILLVGSMILFAFGVVNLKKIGKSSFITLMMVFLVVALLFSLFRFSLPGIPAIPLEVSPAQKAELGLIRQLPLKTLFLGSGPSTFIYSWSKYKPLALNETIFWGTRFSKGASEILDSVVTTGILGTLGILFLIGVFLWKAIRYLFKKLNEVVTRTKISDGASWFLSVGIVASFAGLALAFFLYPANFPILLLFWLLIGAMALLGTDKSKIFILDTSPTKALSFSFIFVLILVLEIGFSIVYFQKYSAEIKYLKGLQAFQQGKAGAAANLMSQAINLNPQIDIYWRDISQVHLVRLNDVLNATDMTQENKNSQAQELVVSTVNAATQSTVINPVDVANWNVRGYIYGNLIGILDGADEWAVKSYEEAAKLEPSNPFIPTEIGKIYLTKSNLASQQGDSALSNASIKSAQTYFEDATTLKPDYAPANYQIASIYIYEGKTDEAIKKLVLAKQAAPQDIGLAFQLGVIYYDQKEYDLAGAEFQRAVALDPGYSNARYFLGLIYDKKGNTQAAIEQFEAVEKVNPDNQEVKQILSNLREGKPALSGIVPSEPPIEEENPDNLKK